MVKEKLISSTLTYFILSQCYLQQQLYVTIGRNVNIFLYLTQFVQMVHTSPLHIYELRIKKNLKEQEE